MDEEDFSKRLVEEFKFEATELLNDFEELLLENEHNISGVDVGNLFRMMHTVKGSAYTVGLAELGGFVHKVEFLLSDIRDDKFDMCEEIIDILLKSHDLIMIFLHHPEKVDPSIVDDISQKIREFMPEDKSAETGKNSPGQSFGFFDDLDDGKSDSEAVKQAVGFFDEMPVERNEAIKDIEKKNCRVLICDDDQDLCAIADTYLRQFNVSSEFAYNGKLALEKIESRHFDILITDLKMPVMSGVRLVEEVRRMNSTLPILVISGFPSLEDFEKLLNLGVHGFLEKPINKSDFAMKVKSCIKLVESRQAIVSFINENYSLYLQMAKLNNQLTAKYKQEFSKLLQGIERRMESIISLSNTSLKI